MRGAEDDDGDNDDDNDNDDDAEIKTVSVAPPGCAYLLWHLQTNRDTSH